MRLTYQYILCYFVKAFPPYVHGSSKKYDFIGLNATWYHVRVQSPPTAHDSPFHLKRVRNPQATRQRPAYAEKPKSVDILCHGTPPHISFIHHQDAASVALADLSEEAAEELCSSSFRFISSFSSLSCSKAAFSICSLRIYSFADSTVAALLLLLFSCASSLDSLLSASGTSSGLPSLLLFSLAPLTTAGFGNSDCISLSASLMRFRRPCSATLWEVRFEVKPVESESG